MDNNSNIPISDTIHKYSESDTVYWFYVRVEIKANRITKKPSYVIRTLSKIPKSGNLIKFDKDLWRNLQGGKNLVIGPFYSEKQANIAYEIYNCVSKNKELNIETSREQVYWFEMKYAISKRKGNFILQAVQKVFVGNYGDFPMAIKHGLKNQRVPIGPFKDPGYVKKMVTPRKTNCGM